MANFPNGPLVQDLDTGLNPIITSFGPQGPQGIQGPQGFQGIQGVQGPNGLQGDMGFQGFQGPQGLFGPQGPQGVSDRYQSTSLTTFTIPNDGATVSLVIGTALSYTPNQTIIISSATDSIDAYFHGSVDSYNVIDGELVVLCSTSSDAGESFSSWTVNLSGAVGAVGADGPQGFQGFQGVQGPQGLVGSQGFQGHQGPQGLVGPQGFQGFQGTQGHQGSTGSQGVQGFQGNQGFQGVTGSQGFQGNIGTTGVQGSTGGSGNQGFQGPTGSTGSILTPEIITYQTPTTGSTANVNIYSYNVIAPAGALLALTIGLPAGATNGQWFEVKFTQAISTLSYSGGTVSGSALTTIATSNPYMKLVYRSTDSTWY